MAIKRITSDFLEDGFRARDEAKAQQASQQLLKEYAPVPSTPAPTGNKRPTLDVGDLINRGVFESATPEVAATEKGTQGGGLLGAFKNFGKTLKMGAMLAPAAVRSTTRKVNETMIPDSPHVDYENAFTAGIGDVYSSAGGAAKWLGNRGTGAVLGGVGKTLQQQGENVPEGLGYDVARAVPFTLSLIPAAVGAGVGGASIAGAAGMGALGTGITGTVSAALASRSLEGLLEAGGTYEEALYRGMSEEVADAAAKSVYVKNMALTGMDAGEIIVALAPVKGFGKIAQAVNRTRAGRVAVGAGRIAGTAGLEAGEEGIQEVFQRQALGDPIALDEQMKKAMTIGGVMGGGMGAAGTGYHGLRTAFDNYRQKVSQGQPVQPIAQAAPVQVPVQPVPVPLAGASGGITTPPMGAPRAVRSGAVNLGEQIAAPPVATTGTITRPVEPVVQEVPTAVPAKQTTTQPRAGFTVGEKVEWIDLSGNVKPGTVFSVAGDDIIVTTDKGGRVSLKIGRVRKIDQQIAPAGKPVSSPLSQSPKKELWEMTQADFINWSAEKTGLTPDSRGEIAGLGKRSDIWKRGHKVIVKKALLEGKPVPPQVLTDYPDLSEQDNVPSEVATVAMVAKEPWQMTKGEWEQDALYHGGKYSPDEYDITKASDEAQYGKGFYAGGEGFAEEWAKERGGSIHRAKLKMDRPFDEKNINSNDPMHQKVISSLVDAGLPKKFVESNYGGLGTFEFFASKLKSGEKSMFPGSAKMTEILKNAGFDGIIGEFRDDLQYAVFDNKQVLTHKKEVQKALSEGKPVPSEVLADYPDLAEQKQEVALSPQNKLQPDIVFREIRDFNGKVLGIETEKYDGTKEGARKAAEAIGSRLDEKYPDWSNINSRIGATDNEGNPKYTVSPNLQNIKDVKDETAEARYTWGDIGALEPTAQPEVTTEPTAIEGASAGTTTPDTTEKPVQEGAGEAVKETTGASLGDYGLTMTKGITKNGNTVWEVTGNTKEHKDALGRAGGRWFGPNQSWSYYGDVNPTARILKNLSALEKKEGAPAKKGQARTEAPSPVKPEKESAVRVGIAKNIRSQAQAMQKTIDAKRNPAVASQNPTARRANIAAGMAKESNHLEIIQSKLSAVADALEAGTLPESLNKLTKKTQVEALERYLSRAKGRREREQKVSYQDSKNTSVSEKDVAFASFEDHAHPSHLKDLLQATENMKGVKDARAAVQRVISRDGKIYDFAEMDAIEALIKKAEQAGKDKGFAKYIKDGLADFKRLREMGIESTDQLQQTLKDYLSLGVERKGPTKEQKIKELERQLIGAKFPGYFPTPRAVVERMLEEAGIEPGMSVLEPSAGKGNIADVIREKVPEAEIDVLEMQEPLRGILEAKEYRIVPEADFLQYDVGEDYDRIIMNPPFEQGQDMDHVKHAYELLKPGGRLVSIMSEGPFFRGDKKATAFREWMDELGGTSEKLPEKSFTGKDADRQTGVAARMVVIDKAAARVKTKPEPKKEPWQMTKEEYNQAYKNDQDVNIYRSENGISLERALEESRYSDVLTALEEGKPVPEEVLKDYPKLVVKEEKPLHLQTKAEATKAARDEFERRKNLPENDMAITSGITRKKFSDKQRTRYDKRLERASVLPALDELKKVEGEHEQAVRMALREGELSEAEYNRLHEKDYGPAEDFKKPTKQEKAKDEAEKRQQRQENMKVKIQENIQNMVPGGKVRHAGFSQIGEVIKVNEKSFRVKVEDTGKIETWSKDMIDVAAMPKVEKNLTGNSITAKTERGTEIKAQYAVVESGDLIASHDTDMVPNEAYPSELQPRQRERLASEDQINRILANLEPEFLGESPKASDGAPIVGPDMVVESGNGRVIALQKGYKSKHDNMGKYKQWLSDNADKLGMDKNAVEKVKNPVLVRVRQSEVDRVKFTREANEQSVAAMSATEQAVVDAKKLTHGLLEAFAPGENGEILVKSNMSFISAFMEQVVSPAERGRYIAADGSVSQEGATRIRNAVYAKTYGDIFALEKLAESTDNNVRTITSAMLTVAPRMAIMKDAIETGALHPLDITGDIAAAMNKLSALREAGDTVETYLKQGNLFGEELSPIAKDLLETFDKYKRSGKKIAEILNYYVDGVEAAGDPRQGNLFGQDTPSKADVIQVAIKRVGGPGVSQTSLFQDEPAGNVKAGIPDEKAGAGKEAPTSKAGEKGELKPSPLDDVQEEMNRKIDEEIGDVKPPAGFSIKVIRKDQSGYIKLPSAKPQEKETYSFGDPEIEERFQAANGMPEESFYDKVKAAFRSLYNKAHREYEHLPRNAEFAELRKDLLKLAKQRGVAGDKTLRLQQGITINLDPYRFDVFRRYVILSDLMEELEAGHSLPFGFTEETLESEWDRINTEADKHPEIREAITDRQKIWKAIVREYTRNMRSIGFNVDKRFTKESYYRHQVIEYAKLKGRAVYGTGQKLKTPTGRGFLKKRGGSEMDINTNYLQAEYEVMAQMLYDVEVARTIKAVDDNYNIQKRLKQEARVANQRAMDSIVNGQDELGQLVEAALKSFKIKLGMSFGRLRKHAEAGELWAGDNDEYQNVVDQLRDGYGSDMDDERNRLFKYLSDLLVREAVGSMEAATILKAVGQRREFIKETLGKDYKTWEDMIPDGYVSWQPREGNIFFMSETIPGHLAEKLFTDQVEQLGISKNDLNRALTIGGRRKEFVVKEEIAATLDNLIKPTADDLLHKVFSEPLRAWKVWQLLSPRRWFKYNFRNMSGDAEAVFIGNPRAFSKLPRAARELYDVFAGDKSMTADMQGWFERGGMETLLQVQELGEINNLRMFLKLQEKKGSTAKIPLMAWQTYWKAVRLSTDYREALLRYASYLDYLQQMEKNSDQPKNFGASIPEEVMALKDNRDRAFKLSNELLGAYDEISVIGQGLRKYVMPFWSWNEVNFRRTIQLMKNAARDEKLAYAVGRKLIGTAAIRIPFLAMKVGKFAISAFAMWTILTLWNNWRFPEEEKELPENVKSRPHIIFGRDKDGKILYFDRLGFVQDFLSWFGMDEAPLTAKDLINGKMTLKEFAVESAKAPVNKLWQSLGPHIKLPVEEALGSRTYPDVFKPGRIRDRWQYLAESFGLGNEYKQLAGKPVPTIEGSRGRGYFGSLRDVFTYSADPGQSAYYDILDEKRRYMKKLNKPDGYSTSPRSDALYNFKLSIRYKDKEAARKYLLEYVMLGGTDKGLAQSLKTMDPLYGLNDEEKIAFVVSLNTEDRQKLVRALQYYQTVLLGK